MWALGLSSRVPSLPPPFLPRTTTNTTSTTFPSPSHAHTCSSSSSRRRCPPPRGTVEKEGSQQFEVDQEKAREALKELDQQLQSLSQQESLPKKRPPSSFPESNMDRDLITGMRTGEMPDIPGSYLTYTAVALLILTIFNNIMFNAFIKPSVDGVERVSRIEKVPLMDPTEQQ